MLVDLRHFDQITVGETNVTVGGGTKIRHLQHKLLQHNKVVHGFGGGTHHQSVAGGISTNLHGAQNCLFADFVLAMTIMTADGEIVTVADGDLFHAAKSGLGQVGVITQVVLRTHTRTCLKISSSRVSIEESIDILHGEHAAAEFKTSGFASDGSRTGVLTTYAAVRTCPIDYDLHNYRDMALAYASDNWLMPAQVLLMPLVGNTPFFHHVLTRAHASTDGDVVGVENGWRADIAPMFGQVYTEYSVPTENCFQVMRDLKATSDDLGVMISGMTLKPLPAESGTLLAYAPTKSCALEVYYLPCQRKMKVMLAAAQNIVYEASGRSHLGKVYIPNKRPIYERLYSDNAYNRTVSVYDPTGLFRMQPFTYEVNYDELYVRAALFRTLVAIAAIAAIVAVGAAIAHTRKTANV